jgi:two-component system sensor histidine kinase AgrC
VEGTIIKGSILFIFYFWEIYLHAVIIDQLFKIKTNQNRKFLFAIINTIVGVVLKLALTPELAFVKSIVATLTILISLKYIFKLSYLKCFLGLILLLAVTAPIETISGLINSKILRISADTADIIKSIPLLITENTLFTLITCLFYCIMNKNFKLPFEDINNRNLYISLFFTVVFIFPNILFYATNNYNYPVYLLVYNILANLGLVTIGIYNSYNYMKLKLKERDLRNIQLYNTQLISLIDSIRVFKHDYNNVVQSIGGYVALKDIEGLSNYYKGLLKDCQRVNYMESVSPIVINEPSIYGIIASKCQIAELKGINFNIESMFDFKKLNMDIYTFCKILGVLLDNALEAAEETGDKIVNIAIKENLRKNIQIVIIENTYCNKSVDIKKIFEKGYSTKKNNSGIGLWEVKNIVNKTINVKLNTSKDKKFFRLQLVISLSPLAKIQTVVEI